MNTTLAKWLSVRLRTKWFWVRVQSQSLNLMTIFQLETFETQITTRARALVHELYGSVAERISHMTINFPYLS